MISSLPSPYKLTEGQTATLVCTVISANPNTLITSRWFKSDTRNTVLHTGSTYTIHNIQRGRSGSYNCTASNAVGTSEPATIEVDVLCMYTLFYVTPYPICQQGLKQETIVSTVYASSAVKIIQSYSFKQKRQLKIPSTPSNTT